MGGAEVYLPPGDIREAIQRGFYNDRGGLRHWNVPVPKTAPVVVEASLNRLPDVARGQIDFGPTHRSYARRQPGIGHRPRVRVLNRRVETGRIECGHL